MEHSPGPAVLITTRPLHNTHTGVDLSVPASQVVRGKMLSGHVEYNIVVVTQLAAFKSAKHKPEDVIQFMVSRKYSEIEEFYQKLVTRHPHASLPPLPRKALLVGESDIRERRAAFDKIMRSLSMDERLATSPELLEFLGSRSICGIDVKGKNLPEEEEEEADEVLIFSHSLKEDATVVVAEEEEEEDDLDPLGVLKSKKKPKPAPSPVHKDILKLSGFDEEVASDKGQFRNIFDEVDPAEGSFRSARHFPFDGSKSIWAMRGNDLKLFDDPNLGERVTLGDLLLLPNAYRTQDPALNSGIEEDMDELLRVEDDFEKMWKLSPEPKPKPKLLPKPVVPKKPTETDSKLLSSPGQGTQQREVRIEAMGEVDILKYIQENESVISEEPTLF